jgi:glycosyltransferase involved in cell wall biosynthesis
LGFVSDFYFRISSFGITVSPVPRRILLLITDLKLGGTPTVVRELATRLNSPPDVLVDVACLAPPGPVAHQLQSANIRVFPLDAHGPTDLGAILRIARLLSRENYDTVFSFLVHANVAAALLKPFFARVRLLQSIQTTQPHPHWHWTAQSIAHHAADTIVVPSESVAQAAVDPSHIPAEKISVISNAIDPAEFSALLTDPAHQHLSESRPIPIGFIGRLDPVKRIPDLIEAVARLPGLVHLHVFGEGAERPRLQRQVAQLNLSTRVTFHGPVPHARDALRQIALLVLPSEAEGFGLVLIEAMAAGVPVVATDAPGIRNVVTHLSTGLLVPIASPPALAAAVQQLIDTPTLRTRLITQAQTVVSERFTWNTTLPQYRHLLGLTDPVPAPPKHQPERA